MELHKKLKHAEIGGDLLNINLTFGREEASLFFIEYDGLDATANANLSARLPYLFVVCHFAHYLKCGFKDREDMQKWINNHVEAKILRRRVKLTEPKDLWQGQK